MNKDTSEIEEKEGKGGQWLQGHYRTEVGRIEEEWPGQQQNNAGRWSQKQNQLIGGGDMQIEPT